MAAHSAQGEQPPADLRALVASLRPLNLLLAATGTVTGALAGGAPLTTGPGLLPLLAAAAVGALGTAGGNLLNDLMDRELDQAAHPERPLAGGRLDPRLAWVALLLLLSSAIALAMVADPRAGLLAAGLVALLVLYETATKGLPLIGNLTVALAAGALFPLGALIADATLTPALILGGLAAFAHLGRELLKDAEDAQADKSVRRTLAVTHGSRTAAWTGAAVLLLAVALSPLPVLLVDWHPLYLLIVSPAVVLLLSAAVKGPKDPRRGQQLAKAAMAAALLAFLLGARI